MIFRNVKTGKVRKYVTSNMIVTAGKNMIADALIGQSSKDIRYCEVGTDGTAPALGDTALGSGLERKEISTREISTAANNTARFTTFYNTSEANGTLLEAGLFGGPAATSTIGTGTLFARTAISRTKTSADTLTLQWDIVIG